MRRALAVRRPPAGLIVHSDQGSQYTATRFKQLLTRYGARQRMSRRGNCYDNAHAHAESFWSRFTAELLDGGSFPGLAEATLEISHHLAYYNAERRHSSLGYQSPNHFEIQFKTTSQLCPAWLDHLITRPFRGRGFFHGFGKLTPNPLLFHLTTSMYIGYVRQQAVATQ